MSAPKFHPGALSLATGGAMSDPARAPAPFTWGAGGQKASPASVKKQQEIAAALMARDGAPRNLGEGLNRVGEALLANSYNSKAEAGQAEGAARRQAVMDALMSKSDPTMADITGAMGNEWVTSDAGSSAIVQALLGQELKQNDPAYQQDLEMNGLKLDALKNPPAPAPDYGFTQLDDGTFVRTDKTSGTVEPMGQFAAPSDPGFRPLSPDEVAAYPNLDPNKSYQVGPNGEVKAIGGGGVNVSVGGNNDIGTIPSGMMVTRDDAGNVTGMSPIPGGPAAQEAAAADAKAASGQGQRDTVTDTITSQAENARNLISGTTTGAGGWALKNLPFSDAADLNRYVGSLKSIAAAENLQAMRAASPTGGALGNASDADIKLLQDKAGALDPASPRFPQMLDDYERNLLRIVHGPENGDKIFEQTRTNGAGEQQAAPQQAAPQAAPNQSQANPAIFGGQGGGAAQAVTATNPQTGERIKFENGQWVPMQ